ncbi:MAG: PD-(D/E)XK nuclease family protein, partial [Proteobacteria bacterium]|nr:PD-(D/E)XK nuclease family protein [Pseudomonadota bacterium]
NFTGSLTNAIKGEESKAAESKRWVDWVSYIFNDNLQEAPIRAGGNKIQTKILREIIRVDEQTKIIDKKDENIDRNIKRYSVSMIRDFAISPQHMLDNIIKSDFAGPVESSEQIGGTVHAVLENYGDQEALKNIFKDLPEKTFKNIVAIVKKFMASNIGKKVFDAKKYKSEHGFITKILSSIVTGRVDRINIYDDKIWVIDYKTGIDEKMFEGYKAQMACYMYYAKRMYPDLRVFGSIIDVTKCTQISYESPDLKDWIENTVKDLDAFLSK